MWNLGGVPAGHIYVERCSIKPDSLKYNEGEPSVLVWYEGRYFKTAEIQDGVLRMSGEHSFGRYSCFDFPLKKLIPAVKLLKPTEVTHADILAQKIAHLGIDYKLPKEEKIEFVVITNQNDVRGSSTEAFLNLKLVEAAGMDKNPEDLVINVIANAILSKCDPKFPEALKGVFLYDTCDNLEMSLNREWKSYKEGNELTHRLARELEKLVPTAKVKVEVVTREAHPEFHDIRGASFFKATLDESEAFLAFGASQTTPAYIYFK